MCGRINPHSTVNVGLLKYNVSYIEEIKDRDHLRPSRSVSACI